MIFDLHDRIELLHLLPKGGVVAEVGVLRGRFSQEIYDIVQPDELHLIDRWQRVWCDGIEQDINEVIQTVRDRFDDKDNVFIHHMDSAKAAKMFPDKFFDWVYLDADHLYDGITADIAAYAPKVKKWLIGHDFQSTEYFGTGVIRAVVEAIQEHGMRMIALTSFDDLPRLPGEEAAFPWGERCLSWVLETQSR